MDGFTTRRRFFQAAAAGGVGAAVFGCATGSHAGPTPPAKKPSSAAPPASAYAPVPLPFDPTKLPGLSEKLLVSHHDNNYAGAVKKLNGVRAKLSQTNADTPGFVLGSLMAGELAFKHSVVLHELYFSGMTGGGSLGSKTQALLSDHFGSAAAWESRFQAVGRSLGGGSGWAILELDLHEGVPRIYRATDHAQGLSSGVPLLVLDMYEHSYHMDYGTAAAKYIDAFFANLHWEELDRRTERALELRDAA